MSLSNISSIIASLVDNAIITPAKNSIPIITNPISN
jgi:hypothetical protein